MNIETDKLKQLLTDILTTPSPTGSTYKAINYIKSYLEELKVSYVETNKGGLIATIEGENNSYQRTISAHVDTLGAMVKNIKPNGKIGICQLGGYMFESIECENCIIETLNGKNYSGTIYTTKPSVHIHGNDARELKRSQENMELILDEKVFSKEDVQKLGINIGDFIFLDPRTKITESGYVKSRHLDDKASVAVMLYAIYHFVKNNVKLPFTTNFYFTIYEEVGHGAASSIPENTQEFLSIDMGAPGEGQNSSEYDVCICAKDSSGPYDLEFNKKLLSLCNENNIGYKIDIYPYYGSDASCALRAGWDIKTALIGTGVYASHSYERTHMDGIINTLNLTLLYCQSK